jgi:hypothetical protein
LLPEIAHYANAFIALVADPEMKPMVAAAPQVGRILRPSAMCRGCRCRSG